MKENGIQKEVGYMLGYALTTNRIQRLSRTHLSDLNSNSLEAEGVKHLSDSLKFNTSLRFLDVGNNAIGDLGCDYIAHGLAQNKALESISDGIIRLRKKHN